MSIFSQCGGWGVGCEIDGVEGFGAAEADGWVFFLLAYVGDVTPATVAFGGGGCCDFYTSIIWIFGVEEYLRDAKEFCEIVWSEVSIYEFKR